jgi:hypothetical protein
MMRHGSLEPQQTLDWVVSDWIFMAEGGAHVICSYHGSVQKLQGMILRLRKIMPSLDDHVMQRHKQMIGGGEKGHSQIYYESIVSKLLSAPGILNIQKVNLPMTFVRNLQISIHTDRPIYRKRYPLIHEEVISDEMTSTIDAQLIPDATKVVGLTNISYVNDAIALQEVSIIKDQSLPPVQCEKCHDLDSQSDSRGHSPLFLSSSSPPVSTCSTTNTWTADIKVKCGLRSTSPFVPQSHKVKKLHGRYTVMQAHKLKCAIRSQDILPWGGKVSTISRYDPLQLTSGVYEQTQEAIKNLFQNPQNNFRILHNRKAIYTGTHTISDEKAHLPDFMDFFCLQNTFPNDTIGRDHFLDILSIIAAEEPIFPQLQALQSVDILDIEGANLVYQHLQSTILGEHEPTTSSRFPSEKIGITSLVDDYIADHAVQLHSSLLLYECADILMTIHTLKKNVSSQYISDKISSLITKLPIYIQDILAMQDDSASPVVTVGQEEINTKIIQKWSAEQCALILNLYLLSLTACDASIVISVKSPESSNIQNIPFKKSEQGDKLYETIYKLPNMTATMIRHQSSDCSGVIQVQYEEEIMLLPHLRDAKEPNIKAKQICTNYFQYTVSVVDIDMKPPHKCYSKAVKENDICKDATELLG